MLCVLCGLHEPLGRCLFVPCDISWSAVLPACLYMDGTSFDSQQALKAREAGKLHVRTDQTSFNTISVRWCTHSNHNIKHS